MAHYMADWHRGELMFVHGEGWYAWNTKHWEKDETGQANRIAQETLKRAWTEAFELPEADKKVLLSDIRKCNGTANGIGGMLKQASAELAFARRVKQLDADPWLLNVANATLDLHTLKQSKHNPADCITAITNAAYKPGEVKPGLWAEVLERVLPDEDVRRFLQRVVGVSLIGKIHEHIFVILYGQGRNGKNVVYEAIMHALGDYAITADPELLRHREMGTAHPTNKMDLRGKRFAVVNETEENVRINVPLLKSLTGDAYIKARWMRGNFEEFTASQTMFMVTNHLPVMKSTESAAWERIYVVPFEVYIPLDERDPNLGEKLKLCADEILAWAIQGLKDYMENGLNAPAAVLKSTQGYQADNDEVMKFIEDECLAGADAGMVAEHWDSTEPLHVHYCAWRYRSGMRGTALGRKQFGKELDRLGYPVKSGGSKPRQGLKIRPKEETA